MVARAGWQRLRHSRNEESEGKVEVIQNSKYHLTPMQYLEDNLGAAKVTLTSEEVAHLRSLAEEIHKTAPGERYPGEFNNLSFIDTPAL